MQTVEARRVPSLFITSVMLGLVGLFLGIGLLNGQREITILSLLVLGMAGGLRLWAQASPFRLRCGHTLNKSRLFAGEKIILNVSAENDKLLPVWLEVGVATGGLSSAPGSDQTVKGEGSLSWRQAAQFQWEISTDRRGVYEIGPVRVASGDLFGFYQKETDRSEQIEVIVYPRLVPLGPFALQKRDFFGIPGGKSPVNDPAYILGTTDYHYGRPAKHIHWKASARHDRLQEKVFEPTQQEKVLFVVDTHQFQQPGELEDFERTLEVVASMTMMLDSQGCGVGLLTNGAMKKGSPFVSITRSPGQVTAILEVLARVEIEPAGTVSDMLRVIDIPWGTSCVYFSFEEDDDTTFAREYLRRRNTPVMFFAHEAVCAIRRDGRDSRADVGTDAGDEIIVRGERGLYREART